MTQTMERFGTEGRGKFYMRLFILSSADTHRANEHDVKMHNTSRRGSITL